MRNMEDFGMWDRSPSHRDRDMAMITHLLGLIWPIVGPLVMWLLVGRDAPFIDRHGREAVNFGITMCIYGVLAFFLCFFLIGFLLLPVLAVLGFVAHIIGAIKARAGEEFHYPLNIRFL